MVMRIGIKALLFVALMGCTRGSRPAGCFVGHDGPIITATFSPDGSYLASIGSDGTVRVWEAASRRELARAAIDPPPRQVTADDVAFAPDSQSLAFAGADNAVYHWRWRTDQPQVLLRMTAPPIAVRFTSDGARVVVASGGYVPPPPPGPLPELNPLDLRVIELAPRRLIATIEDAVFTPLSVALSPDGTRLAVTVMVENGQPVGNFPIGADARGMVIIREIPSGRELMRIQSAGNPLMLFSGDGRYLLVGETIWDAVTGRHVTAVKGIGVAFTEDNNRVLVMQQGMVGNLLATTPSIVPGYVDLRTGYFSRSRRIVLGSPGRSHPPFIRPPVSPDLRYFIDYDLNLWRVNL